MEELIKKAIQALESLDFELMLNFEVANAKKVSDFVEVLKGMDV